MSNAMEVALEVAHATATARTREAQEAACRIKVLEGELTAVRLELHAAQRANGETAERSLREAKEEIFRLTEIVGDLQDNLSGAKMTIEKMKEITKRDPLLLKKARATGRSDAYGEALRTLKLFLGEYFKAREELSDPDAIDNISREMTGVARSIARLRKDLHLNEDGEPEEEKGRSQGGEGGGDAHPRPA